MKNINPYIIRVKLVVIIVLASFSAFSQLNLSNNAEMDISSGTYLTLNNNDLLNSSNSSITGNGIIVINEGILTNLNSITSDLQLISSVNRSVSLGTVSNLVIDIPASLTINDNAIILGQLTLNNCAITIESSKTMSLSGDLINTGSISGSLVLNGTSLQSVDIGNIESLEINNSSGVSLSSSSEITSKLLLTQGLLTTNGNDVTLIANSISSALIVGGNGTVSGSITAQQFIPDAAIGHHYLSTPMAGCLLSELSDDFNFNLSGAYPNIYYYDEPNSAWITPGSSSESMISGKGYTGYFNGNSIVDIAGNPNNGDQAISLTNSVDGWNLIGNPYPSPIDWDLVNFASGISPAFYVWDHDPAIWGRYSTYIDGIGTNGGTNILPMMQSFFIKATSSATLTFQNNDRITDPTIRGDFYKNSKTGINPLIRLQVSGFNFQTETVVRFKSGATVDFDPTLDALLFPSENPLSLDFSSVSYDSKHVVINTFPDQPLSTMVQLYLNIGTTGNYNIDMLEFNNFPSTSAVILHDTKLSLTHDLNNGPYSFVGNTADNDERFLIETLELSVDLSEKTIKDKLSVFLNNGVVNINFDGTLLVDTELEIYNVLGQSIYAKVLNKGSEKYILNRTQLEAASVYFVRIEGFNEVVKLSFVR